MLKHWMAKVRRMSQAIVSAFALFAGAPDRVPAQSTREVMPAGVRAQQRERPWFGFSISCTECRRTESPAGERWSFTVPPNLLAIEPASPAANAGLRAGDVLTHIDGVSLATDAGAERLALVRPGQMVAFTAMRGTQRLDVNVKAATLRVDIEAPRMVAERPSRDRATDASYPVRFSGAFGNTDVVVRGPANTSVRVAEPECWMEIRVGGAIVRLALREGCPRQSP